MHRKTANLRRIMKAKQSQIKIQGNVDFVFMLRVLSCSFFTKIRMKHCVDAKGEYIKGETK